MNHYKLSNLLPIYNHNDFILQIVNITDALDYMQLLISQKSAAGIYNIMPLGLLISNKIKDIIRKHNNALGSELQLSSLIDASIYTNSKRNKEFQTEIFHTNRDLCLQATSEETILKCIIKDQASYKLFPKYYYQITKKFRNEIRPRNNIVRCIEFDMKDGYSFHTNKESAIEMYEAVKTMYQNIFDELGIQYIIMNADPTSMLAASSEEFIHEDNKIIETKEIINGQNINGIEIAHIFYLGTHYSQTSNIRYLNQANELQNIEMCSYGIGIYRLVYIYIKQLLSQELKQDLFIFDIAFICRTEHDHIYEAMQQIINKKTFNILNIDIYNVKYTDKIALCKKIPVKYVIYEDGQEIYIFNNKDCVIRKINKDNISDEILIITEETNTN